MVWIDEHLLSELREIAAEMRMLSCMKELERCPGGVSICKHAEFVLGKFDETVVRADEHAEHIGVQFQINGQLSQASQRARIGRRRSDTDVTKTSIETQPYVFHASPKILRLSPDDMVIRSGIGRALEKRGCFMRLLILILLFAIVLRLFFPQQKVSREETFYDQQVSYQLQKRSPLKTCLEFLVGVPLIFLLYHRIHRRLFAMTMLSTDGMIIFASGLSASCIEEYNRHSRLGADSDSLDVALSIANMIVLGVAFNLGTATVDAIMTSSTKKCIILGILTVYLGFIWARHRCFTDEWGQPAECSLTVGGISTRELYLQARMQTVVFLAKAMVGRFVGDEFLVLRPSYIKACDYQDEDLDDQHACYETEEIDASFIFPHSSKQIEHRGPMGAQGNQANACMNSEVFLGVDEEGVESGGHSRESISENFHVPALPALHPSKLRERPSTGPSMHPQPAGDTIGISVADLTWTNCRHLDISANL